MRTFRPEDASRTGACTSRGKIVSRKGGNGADTGSGDVACKAQVSPAF